MDRRWVVEVEEDEVEIIMVVVLFLSEDIVKFVIDKVEFFYCDGVYFDDLFCGFKGNFYVFEEVFESWMDEFDEYNW